MLLPDQPVEFVLSDFAEINSRVSEGDVFDIAGIISGKPGQSEYHHADTDRVVPYRTVDLQDETGSEKLFLWNTDTPKLDQWFVLIFKWLEKSFFLILAITSFFNKFGQMSNFSLKG